MSAWSCSRCGGPEPVLSRRFQQRQEIRSADGTKRPYSKTVALLCGRCVDEIVAGTEAPMPDPML